VLEEYPCDTKRQLEEQENYYMIQFPIEKLLNTNKAIHNKKECKRLWDMNNRDIKKQHDKKYYETHKEKILEKQKEYRNTEEYKKRKKEYDDNYRKENKEIIKEQRKKRYEENKEKILKERYEKINCECGAEIMKQNKKRHEKSNKHQNYIKNNNK
jgi:hypothetical protein